MSKISKQDGRIQVPVNPELQPLMTAFLQHRREEIPFLQDALEHVDYETVRKLARMIKGVGGGYGFKGLSEIAVRIERAAVRQNPQDIQNGLRDLVDYLGRVAVVYECTSEQPLIVCVDDEASVLALMERALTKNGFRVAGSLGGADAISLIHECKPDLILMDIKMPEISGPDICARLQKSKDVAKIPVIFVTGLNGENDRARAFSSGAVDVLYKPFDLDVLIETAHKTLQAKSN